VHAFLTELYPVLTATYWYYSQWVVPICLRGGGEAEQIEGAALGLGGGGEDSGEAISSEDGLPDAVGPIL
jgi:hypothetical protein